MSALGPVTTPAPPAPADVIFSVANDEANVAHRFVAAFATKVQLVAIPLHGPAHALKRAPPLGVAVAVTVPDASTMMVHDAELCPAAIVHEAPLSCTVPGASPLTNTVTGTCRRVNEAATKPV
jgi:hypothetical protein